MPYWGLLGARSRRSLALPRAPRPHVLVLRGGWIGADIWAWLRWADRCLGHGSDVGVTGGDSAPSSAKLRIRIINNRRGKTKRQK